ncbi:MAG: FAD-binding oxidoreductase [Opitutae bacterium]|nr:FAD-binding oxidoreductase [Opitutae bacterium]
MPSTKEILIIGQGLAGTLLAMELRKAGKKFLIAEGRLPHSASAVAAGILNPVTGKRLAKSWKANKFLKYARETYQELESLIGKSFFRETRLLRLFKDEEEQKIWKKKKDLAEYKDFLGKRYQECEFKDSLKDRHGSFEILNAATLDVQTFLMGARDLFALEGSLCEKKIEYDDISIANDIPKYSGKAYHKVIFCEGFRVGDNPWFQHIPMESSQGEIQTVMPGTPLPEGIINCGKWLRPLGNGIFQAGSTHKWNDILSAPQKEDDDEIKEGMKKILHHVPTLIRRETGIRPASKDRKPVVGFHPQKPCLGILNGLGAKGSMMGPWMARHLSDVIQGLTQIDSELDVRRYFN